ncbi:MAG: transposase, partial [Pseudonocardiaceae bacterium]
AVLIYAHAVGVRSSREIERLCRRDVAFRVLATNLAPDHATIARFLTRHRDALSGLFVQALRLCHEAGMVRLGEIAIDGTRIAANASINRGYTEAALGHQVAEAEAALAAGVAELLDEHAATDVAEDALFGPGQRGDELPPDLRGRGERLTRLRAARDRLAADRQRVAQAHEAKKQAWQARKDAGRSPGRKPADAPPPTSVAARGKPPRANTTDPDCRLMRFGAALLPGYNAQAAVTDTQVIIGHTLTENSSDQHQLHDVLDATRTQLARAGIDPTLSTVLADSGYATEETFARGEDAGLHVLAPIPRGRPKAGEEEAAPRDLTRYPATARAQAKLATPQGQWHYAQRGQTVEPVFGQIKDRQRLRQFTRRGLTNADAEWALACTVHNIRKLHKHRKATG